MAWRKTSKIKNQNFFLKQSLTQSVSLPSFSPRGHTPRASHQPPSSQIHSLHTLSFLQGIQGMDMSQTPLPTGLPAGWPVGGTSTSWKGRHTRGQGLSPSFNLPRVQLLPGDPTSICDNAPSSHLSCRPRVGISSSGCESLGYHIILASHLFRDLHSWFLVVDSQCKKA